MKEILKSPKPLVIAHRGDSRHFPENTSSSFRSAIEKGAQMIECDVQLSRDRVPMIIHDPSLDRTTNGTGKIGEETFDELLKLDCGSWFSESFHGETILSLQQMLERFSGQILLNLEIKKESVESEMKADGIEALVCNMVHDYGFQDRVLISSFHHVCLKRVKEHDDSLPVAPLLDTPKTFSELQMMYKDHDAFSIHMDEKHLERNLIQKMKESGIPLLCYTVNDLERKQELTEWGITGIISDDTTMLKKIVSYKILHEDLWEN